MRLQILHLPAPAHEYPFALILDQAGESHQVDSAELQQASHDIGAKAVLVFADTVEIV